jgi:hypothetical protein
MIKFSEKQLFVVELSVVILTAILLFFNYLLFHSFVEILCAMVALALAARHWQQHLIYTKQSVDLLFQVKHVYFPIPLSLAV